MIASGESLYRMSGCRPLFVGSWSMTTISGITKYETHIFTRKCNRNHRVDLFQDVSICKSPSSINKTISVFKIIRATLWAGNMVAAAGKGVAAARTELQWLRWELTRAVAWIRYNITVHIQTSTDTTIDFIYLFQKWNKTLLCISIYLDVKSENKCDVL